MARKRANKSRFSLVNNRPDPQRSLESLPVDEPPLPEIIQELQQAQSDGNTYCQRLEMARRWWRCEWDHQFWDGRKHLHNGVEPFPWEGASDSRTRIVQGIINEHVTFAKAAFWNAKIQAMSTRPIVYGRERNVADKALKWRIYTSMRREINRELTMAFLWRFGFGLSFLWVEWEQQRTVMDVPIDINTIAELARATGNEQLLTVVTDPDSEREGVQLLQSFSQVLDTERARQIIRELRETGQSAIPTINLTVNKPKWSALKYGEDIMIPAETDDIQFARWVSRREFVTESELVDRIGTDGYDPLFVEEALEHKGEFADWMQLGWDWRYNGLNQVRRNLIELHHFRYKSVADGVPCVYRTVFCAAVKDSVAVHRKAEYDHQQYPVIALRRTFEERPLLSSRGIAEEAYTDEQDIKVQQDGLTDRTDLIHNFLINISGDHREFKSLWGPKAIMESFRPGDISYPPLPPIDQTPAGIIEMVQARLDRRYWMFGPNVDPNMSVVRKQELADDVLQEIELAVDQTFQLMQQFESDQDMAQVAGGSVHASAKDIQGQYQISATVDVRDRDLEYAKEKIGLYAQAMQFNQAGTANMAKFFNKMLEVVEPDIADLVTDDQQTATQRELDEERGALNSIMSGVEPPKPMYGNHQLRMQWLLSNTIQSPNPMMAKRLQMLPDSAEMLKNRLEFFRNQIQQTQQNPMIGRALSTQTFNPKAAPQLTT